MNNMKRSEVNHLRVAIVHRGLTRYRLPLYKYLYERNNINFHVFSRYFKVKSQKLGFSEPRNNEIIRLPITRVPLSKSHIRFYNRFKIYLPSIKLIREIISYKPNLIILESLSNIVTVLLLTPHILYKKIPFFWWGLGKIPDREDTIRSAIGDRIQQFYIKKAKAILSYSNYGKEFYINLGCDPKKIFVLYNTLDEISILKEIEKCKQLVPNIKSSIGIEDQPVAIFSGTINSGKKLDLLIKSFKIVKENLITLDPKLIIIGDGSDLNKCIILTKKLGLNNSVIFVGRQENNASAYFLLGHVAVMPGLGGLGINHAFIHKLPMICGNADGCERDLVENGKTGYLLEQMSEINLADKLTELMADKDLSAKLGRNAFKLIKTKISINNMVSIIERSILHKI